MSHPSAADTVLTFDAARVSVEKHAASMRPSGSETVHLIAASDRVIAEDIYADRDLPPFPRATRDGYAVRSQDLSALPASLKVMAQIKAGSALSGGVEITTGTCAEIMTGAPVPDGTDSVVMVEFTSFEGDYVSIQRGTFAGENIVPRGSEAKASQLLLPRGLRLDHTGIAVAASVGKAEVTVYKRPRIAILSTGDEVVEVASTPKPHQIRNSNAHSLAAQITAAGAEPVILPIAPDEPTRLRELIQEGFKADLLLLSGGVSMGKYDLVENVLNHFDCEFFFTGVKMQPGKPVICGHSRKAGRSFVGLPGNPISTMVTFELFARPLIDALSGAAPSALLFARARLAADFTTKPGLTRFLPALLSGPHSDPMVELIRWQGSGDVVSMSKANCLLVVPPDKERLSAGEQVSILLR